MSKQEISIGCSWFGCLGVILLVTALWALIFGVTWNGQHHGIGCSSERGVEIR